MCCRGSGVGVVCAAMAFPKRLLVDGEELVLSMHPHAIVLVFPAIVSLLVVAAWGFVLPNLPSGTPGMALMWLVLGGGVLLLLVYPLRAYLKWSSSYFVVTSDRVIHRSGIIGKYSMEIPLEAINDVRFNQSIFERLIGGGDLVIESAGEAGRQVFEDIRHPESVQRTIYEQGEGNQRRMYAGLGGGGQASTPGAELERLEGLRDRGSLTAEEFEEQKRRLLE